jgi:hypothetical protein
MAKAAGSSGLRLNAAQAAKHALGTALGALAMVMLHPVVGLPIAAAALAGLVYGGRGGLALLTSVAAGILAGLIAHASGLYVVVFPLVGVAADAAATCWFTALTVASFVLVGPGTVRLMRTGSPYRAIAVVVLGLSVAQALLLSMFAAQAGQTVQELVGTVATQMVTQAGVSGDMADAISSSWPGLLVSMNAIAALLIAVLVGRAGVRNHAAVRTLPPLARLDLDPRMAILPIAAIAFLASGRLPLASAEAIGVAGANLLVVARWLFFLQGVAVFAGLYERAGFSRTTRAAGYVLLGVTEALLPLVSLTGLADIWLNMRRLPRDGVVPETVERPPHRD